MIRPKYFVMEEVVELSQIHQKWSSRNTLLRKN